MYPAMRKLVRRRLRRRLQLPLGVSRARLRLSLLGPASLVSVAPRSQRD
jgi:hypothetical protein